jgi:inner membrane protein
MASAFSHAFVATALGSAYARPPVPWYFWVLSITCSILPDADVIGFALGLPYNSLWGHRGLSHSLCFAFVLSLCVVSLAFREGVVFSWPWWSLVLYFFVVTASHGVLDAMTDGGRGIAFFAPFDTTRYFFPWRPVRVSPISIKRFSVPEACRYSDPSWCLSGFPRRWYGLLYASADASKRPLFSVRKRVRVSPWCAGNWRARIRSRGRHSRAELHDQRSMILWVT